MFLSNFVYFLVKVFVFLSNSFLRFYFSFLTRNILKSACFSTNSREFAPNVPDCSLFLDFTNSIGSGI